METEFGVSPALSILNAEDRKYLQPRTTTSYIGPDGQYKLLSSEDFGDPTLDQVIQWHLSLCQECDPTARPAVWGKAPKNFCPEYWEIISEYREYESYAMNGNP